MPPVIKTSIKHHSNEVKRAAIELRKAGVSLSNIRTQLKLPEATRPPIAGFGPMPGN
jgi:DNA-binding transcriptional MerR regulator